MRCAQWMDQSPRVQLSLADLIPQGNVQGHDPPRRLCTDADQLVRHNRAAGQHRVLDAGNFSGPRSAISLRGLMSVDIPAQQHGRRHGKSASSDPCQSASLPQPTELKHQNSMSFRDTGALACKNRFHHGASSSSAFGGRPSFRWNPLTITVGVPLHVDILPLAALPRQPDVSDRFA